MYIKLLIFEIVFFIQIRKIKSNYIKYPFKRVKKGFNEILKNDLEITLEIGTPPQKMNLNLRSQSYTFFISGSEVNNSINKFNEKESISCKKVNEYPQIYSGKEYSKGYKIYETLIINGKKINNISLILASELNYIESGALGLKLIDSIDKNNDLSFIYQIKNLVNLNNYSFTLNYFNDDNGEIIIGTYPHSIDKKYSFENFIYKQTGIYKSEIDWIFSFDIIQYGNKSLFNQNENNKCLISIEFGLISAPEKMRNFFLDYFLNENNCKPNFIENHIIYICKENVIRNFKKMIFFSKDLKFEFEFDYQDLFIKSDNTSDEYIFSIAFQADYSYNPIWILGHTFLKKYQLTFDLDKKIIGLYSKLNYRSFNWRLFLNIFFFIIICILVVYIIKYFKKPRKIRANELIENIDYISSE